MANLSLVQAFLKFRNHFKTVAVTGSYEDLTERPTPTEFTIETTDWAAETSGNYEYYADITITGATANDKTDIDFDEDSLEVCAEAGVSSATNTSEGVCRIRSVDIPADTLTGNYTLIKGAVS